MSEQKTETALEMVKYVTSIRIGATASSETRATKDTTITLVSHAGMNWVRVKTNRPAILVPMSNVAFVIPAKVEAQK